MKFIYIADTHIGASDTEGYRQQPRYLARLNELMDTFREWASRNKIDFIIHGGDIIENTTVENIQNAAGYFETFTCPVYATLGNHDLTVNDSRRLWLDNAPGFFPGNKTEFAISHSGIDFLFLTSHWGKTPYYWDPNEPQIPYFLPDQWKILEHYEKNTSSPMVLVTHSQIFGLPCGQTGFTEELHPPLGEFASQITEKTAGLPLKMVLGAHNHLNMNIDADGINYVTVSALTETPFEFKLFETDGRSLSMKTVSLAQELNFKADYCFDTTFVQGRPCDRSFEKTI